MTVAQSLPEMVILRRRLTYRLIGIFIGFVSAGTVATGFLFNILLWRGAWLTKDTRTRNAPPSAQTIEPVLSTLQKE